MQWASAVVEDEDLEHAIEDAATRCLTDLGGERPDLVLAFASPHFRARASDLPKLVSAALECPTLIGCIGGGVIGAGRELEGTAGLSLIAARLPGVRVTAFHVDDASRLADDEVRRAFVADVGSAEDLPVFVLIPDPFSFDVETFVRVLDETHPESLKIGGLASGGAEPGTNALFLGNEVHASGAVGLSLSGNVVAESIVAQGCRPIGQPMFVTSSDRNLILALDGRPALEALHDVYRDLGPEDHGLFRQALFVGFALSDDESDPRRGDFLVRNVLGADGDRGAIAVGADVRSNTVIQFHVRDGRTSSEDLEEWLATLDEGRRPAGSLLFSCLGRGVGLYGAPDHDSTLFRRHLGDVPIAGFFCNGEIGPVRGQTFLHGYTSAFVLFHPRR